MSPSPKLSFLLALSLVVAGCTGKPSAPRSQPLARLGDEVLVTTDELDAELRNRSPTVPSGQIDAAAKRELLDRLIQFELLCREAQRDGLQQDDEVQRQLKKAMVNRFMQYELDQDPRAAPDTDAELLAFFEQHKGDYARPERLRLMLIELAPHGNAVDPPPEALKVVSELKARGEFAAAFAALARETSVDQRTRGSGGETDWALRADLAARYGEPVVAAAERLQPDQTSDPVRGKDGWFLVRLAGRQEATNPTFEQLKPMLKARSYHDKHAAASEAYENELRKRSPVKIDEEVLSKVDPLKLGDEKPGQPAAAPKP